MEDVTQELNETFAPPTGELRPEVLGELKSILRLHSIDPQELWFKWESYSIKMGAENTVLDLKTVRDFKKDIQDSLERESRGKVHIQSSNRKPIAATPRHPASTGDVFQMLDGLVPNTLIPIRANGASETSLKRKNNFQTPAAKASKKHLNSSPHEFKTPYPVKEANGGREFPFEERTNAGDVTETLNSHIDIPESLDMPPSESRIKIKANTEISKFSYKPMAMKLSEASEILDDRIDEFLAMVQESHDLEDGIFGNPAAQSTSEIVAVGRIASDSLEGKLNVASLVLETSRRTGAGLRVPLKMDAVQSYEFFPGKIVAIRGSNTTGEYFTVNEILSLPLLPLAASSVHELDTHCQRLASSANESSSAPRPLNLMISSGAYTTSTSLDYSPLSALIDTAIESHVDALVLIGPLLDIEHPSIISGAIDLPTSSNINPDTATLTDVFRALVSPHLQRLCSSLPACTVIIVPSLRDALSKHVSYPQDKVSKHGLNLPKQCVMVTNPITLSLNEIVIGISSQDILYEMRREEVAKQPDEPNLLHRLSAEVIQQRHFFPLFPPARRESLPRTAPVDGEKEGELPVGSCLDVSYLKLGEWLNVRPDILILPSALPPFAKVVDSVVVVNPGTLSKRKGPGTYARFTVLPPKVNEEVRETGQMVVNNLFERTRVDIVRI